MKKIYIVFSCLVLGTFGQAQMVIQAGSTVFLESGAKLIIQGDFTSSSPIQGAGTVVMKGTSLQSISLGGNTVPSLEIDNPANVTLSGSSAKIGTNLLFTNGKLLTGVQDLVLAPAATISGHNASRFIWTDGTGQVKKELTGDVSNVELPLGENNNYRPAFITTTGGSYSGATIGVRNAGGVGPNRPPSIASQLVSYWGVSKSGITGGTQTVTGQYLDTDITGTEANLRGYYFNGTDWVSVGGANNVSTNRVTAQLSGATGEITAMNKFLAVGARAFLQGAFNSTTGLMNDALRSGVNVIPTNDPYGTAPYTNFADVNNPISEVVAPSIFADQSGITSANDNIVDWIFLQLRNTNASPGNVVLQTRSALIQRDGDIVDVDGKSPVTFNNVLDGSYVLTIRHRNHLALSTDNMTAGNWRTFTEARSLALSTNQVDFRTEAPAKFYGGSAAFTTATIGGNTFKLLWAGDVSSNGATRFQGASPGQPNDRVVLLQDLGNNESSVLSTYQRGDVNLNKNTRYTGSSGPGQLNDRLFILQVLSNTESAIKTQSIPN